MRERGRKPEFEIEKLSREHDVCQFDCGNPTLNGCLQKYAWIKQEADLAKTYLASASNLVVGYRQQGKGLGKALFFDALSRIEQAADIVAVRAAMVYAIDEAARRFYEPVEFEPSPVDPFRLLLLLKDLRKALK